MSNHKGLGQFVKQFVFSILIVLFISTFSSFVFALSGDDFEYHGYFRSGVGNNSKGGNQICLTNPGAGSNEFRIGNECTSYGEIAFVGHHLKPTSDRKSYFRSQIRLAFNVATDQDWETNQSNRSGQTINLDSDNDGDVDTDDSPFVGDTDGGDLPAFREAYLEGGNFDGLPVSFWVGKRFYREQDIFLYDTLFFADLSGPGAGIGNIPFLRDSKLHFAHLKRVDSSGVMTNVGTIPLNIYDIRIKGLKLTESDSINFWLARGNTSEATGVSDNKNYSANNGQAYGFLWQRNLRGGFNHLQVVYGKGLLDSFNVWGTLLTEVNSLAQSEQNKSNRWRVANHTTLEPNQKWAFHSVLLYERRDDGSVQNALQHWYSIALQPIYRVSDHFHFVSVLGTSMVDAEGSGPKRLTRLTLAPQVSVGRSIWARPTIRFFYTRSWWNKNNQGSINSDVFANELSGGSWGVQGEVWF